MNDSILGIVITFLVLGIVLSIVAAEQYGTDFCDIANCEGITLPQINAGTNTNNDGFYDYCYRMGFDC
jgi:hypothetical protein